MGASPVIEFDGGQPMIQPWRATCMQVYCNLVNGARNRDEAMTIIHRSLDRWSTLMRGPAIE